MRKCEDLISGTKIQAFLKQQKVKFEHELLENIIGVAVSPSGEELHNKELRHLFNKTWSENISIPLPPTLPSAEGPDINTDLENILLQHFKHHPNIGNKIIHRCCDETRKAGVHASCHYQNQCEEKGTESLQVFYSIGQLSKKVAHLYPNRPSYIPFPTDPSHKEKESVGKGVGIQGKG